MSLIERAIQRVRETAGERAALPHGFAASVQALDALAPAYPRRRRAAVMLDREALRRGGLLVPLNKEQQFARQYRRIKTPLLAAALGRAETLVPQGHLIMVASALPGEGKTFTSLNLALSLARERDIDVLLVDADVPKPHISDALGLSGEPGLMNALADHGPDVTSLVLPTDVPRLSVLPAGRCEEDGATELLNSARMEALVRRLVAPGQNRIVVIDSPPVLATTEAHALARLVGQIVLVVRAGTTPQAAVLDAVDLLGDKPIGVVLNLVRREPSAGYYGYGYGYGDGVEQGSSGGHAGRADPPVPRT